MCGIVGISHQNSSVNAELLKCAADSLSHRGPDDQGLYVSPDTKTGFAHRRLSFLDLTAAGRQPMSDLENKITVMLNGEIYNYLELKLILEKEGYIFRTRTDTEVLIWGYKHWGKDLPKKLEGMFAFAILDLELSEIIIVRDRFGIKPLFYYQSGKDFIFGSELKALTSFNLIPAEIDPASVSLFLANRYVPAPKTIWKNVYKVLPGEMIVFSLRDFTKKHQTWWKITPNDRVIPYQQAFDQFRDLLQVSVKQHLRSEVPIGSFLSGGFDSSTLTLLMQNENPEPVHSFSIGFENWNESEHQYAQMVADKLGARLHHLKMDHIDLSLVKKLMHFYDDPIADISILPSFQVSELASKTVKAVLSGDGADEMLGGYWWDKPENFHFQKSFLGLFSKSSKFGDIKSHYINAMSMGLFDRNELQKALAGNYKSMIPDDPFEHFNKFELQGSDVIQQIQFLDLHTFMPELILVKMDRASMANSLEVRVPFLNHHLMEFVLSLSSTVYTQKGVQKPFLRDLLKGKVPDEILSRKKQGFVGPDAYYMDYNLYKNTLVNGRLIKDEVINGNYVQQMITHKEHWKLWKLFVLENWWQNWMNG